MAGEQHGEPSWSKQRAMASSDRRRNGQLRLLSTKTDDEGEEMLTQGTFASQGGIEASLYHDIFAPPSNVHYMHSVDLAVLSKL